jgi:hypothetical protein
VVDTSGRTEIQQFQKRGDRVLKSTQKLKGCHSTREYCADMMWNNVVGSWKLEYVQKWQRRVMKLGCYMT